jgi:hypothetical protein
VTRPPDIINYTFENGREARGIMPHSPGGMEAVRVILHDPGRIFYYDVRADSTILRSSSFLIGF